jgi:hypothetical protein
MQHNRSLLIPICVQLHSSLLHQHAAKVFGFIKRVSGEIAAFHDYSF